MVGTTNVRCRCRYSLKAQVPDLLVARRDTSWASA